MDLNRYLFIEFLNRKNIDIGVLALSTNPQKSEKKDVGEVNVELNFFNTSFIPGHYLYADLDGLLVSKTKIDIWSYVNDGFLLW